MELLRTLGLAMRDAARAERLASDPGFRMSLRRYPTVALSAFAVAHDQPPRDAVLSRIERIVLQRKIA